MPKILQLLLKHKKVYICVVAVYVALFVLTAFTIARKTVNLGELGTLAYPIHHTTARSTQAFQPTQLPTTFRGTKPNVISYPEALTPVLQRLHQGEAVRVLQIGDSHVRGNYFPNAVGETLQRLLGGSVLEGVDMDVAPAIDGGISFDYLAKNGAHASLYCEPDKIDDICARRPDLLIVSFGTNEAHGHFDSALHQQTLQQLVSQVRERCPDVCFLFTTPPGSYVTTQGHRWRDRRGRWHYNTSHGANPRTETVAQAIDAFAREQHHAVWNIFEIAGGAAHAAANWRNGGYMQADCIHYTAQAYTLQGQLLGEAIAQAYFQQSETSQQSPNSLPPTPSQ